MIKNSKESVCPECNGKGFIDVIPVGIERKEILPGLLEPEIKGIACQMCRGTGYVKQEVQRKPEEGAGMSEHLFKGKDAETKEWVEGYLWSERTIGFTSPCGNVDEVVVDPNTVCQCVGLVDRKGATAFESDVVLDRHTGKTYTIMWDGEMARFVLCDECGWMSGDISRLFYCEIVGNVFDEEDEEE